MAKKKKHNPKKLLSALLLILNLLVGIPFLFAFFAQFIPASATLIAVCGLAFPYLLIANGIIAITWLFVNYRFSLISIILLILNLNNIDRHFQFKATEKPTPCVNCVKVMSYNVRLFNFYNENKQDSGKGKSKILRFLKEEQPDIVCFQEYFYETSPKIDFSTTDTILSVLNLQKKQQYYYQYFPKSSHNHHYFFGLAIFSRYRIINTGVVQLRDSSANSIIYADIKFKGDTVRIYNVHLASLRMGPEDYAAGKELSSDISSIKLNNKTQHLYSKIANGFDMRTLQVKAMKADMDSCTHPVIICGDFNDSPASYSYNQIAKNLNDSFRKSGKGTGTTYHSNVFPAYRIDYILYDPQYRAYGHTIATELEVSDHYPIYTYISLQKKKF